MDELEKRRVAEEAKFAKEEEKRFKVRARRNKLLGEWAGDLMGLSQEETKKYADRLIGLDIGETGEEVVFKQVRADFDAAKVEKSDHQIRRTMAELLETAAQQLENRPSS